MYYNSISIHSFSMFMSLEGLFKTISYIVFEEKISKFQKKNNLTFVYITIITNALNFTFCSISLE